MASNTVGELDIEITSNTLKFEKGLKKAENNARNFSEIAARRLLLVILPTRHLMRLRTPLATLSTR